MKTALSLIKEDLKKSAPALIPVVIYCTVTQLVFDSICPLVVLTGLPCPSCGMTRSFVFLVTGRWHEALRYNIMVVPWILLAVAFVVTRYFVPAARRLMLPFLCLVCLATFAYFIIRIIYTYPSEPVMIYHEPNLIKWGLL